MRGLNGGSSSAARRVPSALGYCLFVILFSRYPQFSVAFSIAPRARDNITTAAYSRLFAAASKKRSSGGRAPGQIDIVGEARDWTPTPCEPTEARLTVVQITDTYTLEHLPSVKTLLKDVRERAKGSQVISCMTGDFLAPYLLSSVDRGQGMMNALSKIPIDYLTWGNHEVSGIRKRCTFW